MRAFNFTVYKIMLKRKRKYLQRFKNNAVTVSHRCFRVFSVLIFSHKRRDWQKAKGKTAERFPMLNRSVTRL